MKPRPYNEQGQKQCGKCLSYKNTSEFGGLATAPDGLQHRCKLCRKSEIRIRKPEDPAKARLRSIKYRDSHKDALREYRRIYYRDNREQIIQRATEWNRAHPDKAQKHVKAWNARNPARIKQYSRNGRIRNGSVFKARRRARKIGAEGWFTRVEWSELKARYKHTCLCCWRSEPDVKIVPDHVIPLSKGGSNWIDNIQPLCESCNHKKYDKLTDYR